MEGLTALIGLDFNLHEILAIVFCCQRLSKFKREHSGFFVFELLEFFFALVGVVRLSHSFRLEQICPHLKAL